MKPKNGALDTLGAMIAEVRRRRRTGTLPRGHAASVVFAERFINITDADTLGRILLLALAGMGWYETRHNGELPTVVDGDSELDRLGALDTEELVALALAGFIALVDEQLE